MHSKHPWQSGPTELIKYAIEHLDRENDFDQRIAFLLLDVGVETLFKTFLLLPGEVTGTKTSYQERKNASTGNFHELTRAIKKAAGNRLHGLDLAHIQFYHDLRNKLYHQGNGITVPNDLVKGYASITVEILKRLLGVDLESLLDSRKDKERLLAQEQSELYEFGKAKKRLLIQLEDLGQVLRMALEDVEPTLVLPSTEYQWTKWKENTSTVFMAWLSRMSWEKGHINATSVGDDLRIEKQQYISLLEEIQPTMPNAFQNFIKKHNNSAEIAFNTLRCHHFEEALLVAADIALELPTDLSGFVYWEANLISRAQSISEIEPLLGENYDNFITELIKHTVDLGEKVEQLSAALAARTPSV